MKATPKKVYNSVMKLWNHLVLINKQSYKWEKKFINYKKANEAYVIDNSQLQSKNKSLETQFTNLEK